MKKSIFIGSVAGLVVTGLGSSGLLAILKYREGDPGYLIIYSISAIVATLIFTKIYKNAKKAGVL